MSRIKTFAALALGISASACSTVGTNQLTASNNPSMNSVHQPVVQRTDFVLDLAAQGDRLPDAECGRLEAWFDAINLRYGDTVWVDDGTGATGARADVAQAAAARGLLIAEGSPVTVGEVPAGAIRVIASRSTASVPNCPDWDPRGNGIAPPQGMSTNYGCSVNSNLAAMIANPEDLVRGREPSGNGAAATAGRAIRVYREVQPTGRQGLQQNSTTGGN